jgi:uncharacterized membrane protein YiaA
MAGALFVWLLLAILIGVWAANRGRSGFGYFVLALLLSPLIGFIIVAVIGPSRDAVEARQLESGDSKRCPQCAELIRAQAMKCRYCGSELA